VLFLLAAAMLAPGLVVGPSLDAAVFNHLGAQLLHGVPPYLGAWDHKPPGIYLASAGVQAVLGWLGSWTADWLLSAVATAGSGIAVATALARLGVTGWPRAAAAAGATILASHYLLALGGGLTEPLATLLLGWALVLAVRYTGRGVGASIGVLVGVSALMSLQALPGGLVVLGLALFLQPRRERLRALGMMALGFAAPVAMAAAWLQVTGALPAALDAIVTYSGAYRASSGDYGAVLGAPVAAWTVLVALFLVAPALLGAMSAAQAPQRRRGAMTASLIWIGGSLLLFVVQGRFYAHYAIPLAVPFGILAGPGLQRVGESLSRTGRSGTRAVIVLPLIITLLVSVLAGIVSTAMQVAPVADKNARMDAVSQQLRDLRAGTMLVWGNEPRLYELAQRGPATRYSYLYPLTTPGYSTPALIDEVVRALADDPPAVVIDAGSDGPGLPGFLPLLIARPIATDGRDLDLLDPLREFVAGHYDLVAIVSGWPIYVLRDPG